jgi:exonuclease III
MFISPKLAPFIHSHGNFGVNLCQWVRFHNIPGGDFSIANIYAPHSNPLARAQLWQELTSKLDPNCRWILCGDWNMVEDSSDKSSTNGRILSGFEKTEFELLKAHLFVEDYFDRSNLVKFSWSNRRHDDHRTFARLDRFYTFANFANRASSHILK